MKSETVRRLLQTIPETTKFKTDFYVELMMKIDSIFKKKNITIENTLRLEKDSQVRKWLCGEFDYSLDSILYLSVELDMELLKL